MSTGKDGSGKDSNSCGLGNGGLGSEKGSGEKMFDMRNNGDFNEWMSQSIQFAMVASGRDSILESDVRDEVMGVVDFLYKNRSVGFPDGLTMREVVVGILERANYLVGEYPNPLGVDCPGSCPDGNLSADSRHVRFVMQWVLMTVAAVWICRGRGFHHEHLEAEVDHKIVGGIQGGRLVPSVGDLGLVVRKVILWGLGDLSSHPVVCPVVVPASGSVLQSSLGDIGGDGGNVIGI